MKLFIFVFIFVIEHSFALHQSTIANDKTTYEAIRIGYFHATLIVFMDSTYEYSDWNHKGATIKDKGKLIAIGNKVYLNSDTKTTRKTKTGHSPDFYLFIMKEIEIDSSKIIVLPLDSVFPEYNSFYRKE